MFRVRSFSDNLLVHRQPLWVVISHSVMEDITLQCSPAPPWSLFVKEAEALAWLTSLLLDLAGYPL